MCFGNGKAGRCLGCIDASFVRQYGQTGFYIKQVGQVFPSSGITSATSNKILLASKIALSLVAIL